MSAFVDTVDRFLAAAVDLAWGLPLVALLIGAGLYLSFATRGVVFRGVPHALALLRWDDDRTAPGEISHFHALSSALSATLGIGNIGGVAIAVAVGGPGAVFWMWIAGIVGMATKFVTCTLACLYRKEDSHGVAQGGPMYFLEVGLGPRFKPLAMVFSICGMIGCLALFQSNQVAALLAESHGVPRLATGVAVMAIVGAVVVGGITRIGRVAARLVPAMTMLYLAMSAFVLIDDFASIPALFAQIVRSAFDGTAVAGGAAGVTAREALVTGVRRAAFSNEAGIGTAALAHGAARTREPVREGLVAMLGPFIDTNVVCTLTALVILSTGVDGASGVALTASAFEAAMPEIGAVLLTAVVLLFGVSTMISYSYYSQKCAIYVLGERIGARYVWVYLLTLPIGAVWAQDAVINLLDTAFALMSIPTLTGALLLSPKVVAAMRDYFARLGDGSMRT